jgi:hypothetical protein
VSTNPMRRLSWMVAFLSLLWAALLALDWVPSLRGDYGWRWPYAFPPQYPGRLIGLALVLAIYCIVAWWLYQKQRSHWMLLWAVAGSIALSLGVLYVATTDLQYELYTRTLSGLTTGGHNAATQIDDAGGALAVLRNWPEFARSFGDNSHISTSPPGIPLIYYAANRLLEHLPSLAAALGRPLRAEQCHNLTFMAYSNAELASAWLGIFSPLWVALTALPLYWLGRCMSDKQAVCRAVLWRPLVPAAAMFAPLPSTVYPLLAVSSLALFAHGLKKNAIGWAVAAGLVTSVMTFINLSLLPIILLVGLWAIFYTTSQEHFSWRNLLLIGLGFSAGLLSIWAALFVITGTAPWSLFSSAMSEHLSLDRPYFPWLILSLNDFFMFTGWPLVLLAALGVWHIVKKPELRRAWPLAASLAIALAITLLAVDLSGTVQGESGRILLYLSPLVLLIASMAIQSGEEGSSSLIVTAAQAVVLLVLVACVHVVDSGLSSPPAAPPDLAETPPPDYLPSGSVFDGALRLERFAGQVEMVQKADGGVEPTLMLWLDWQSIGQVDQPYYLSFIPVAPDGQAAPEATLFQPFDAKYPITCWLPSSGPIRSYYAISLPDTTSLGDWWISLSLVDGRTGQTPSVVLPDGSQSVQVGIGPFHQSE